MSRLTDTVTGPGSRLVPRPRRRVDVDLVAEVFRRRRPAIEPVVSDRFRAELRDRLTADRGAA